MTHTTDTREPRPVTEEAAVYIASRFSRRHECHALAQILKRHGATITARWVKPDTDHIVPVGSSEQAADAERERFALEDVEDVQAANWTISLTEEPRSNGRGGRHVEFGIAVALSHRLTVIGPRETVFHHLPQVEHYETVDAFVAALLPKPVDRATEASGDVLVTDDDRIRAWQNRHRSYQERHEEEWFRGEMDSLKIVQDFARHRIAAFHAGAEHAAEPLVEALRTVLCCTPAAGNIYDCGDPFDIARAALAAHTDTGAGR